MIFPMNARCADTICSAGCAVWSSSLDMQPAAPRLVTHQRLTVVAAVTGCNQRTYTLIHIIYPISYKFIGFYWILFVCIGFYSFFLGIFHRLSIIDYFGPGPGTLRDETLRMKINEIDETL